MKKEIEIFLDNNDPRALEIPVQLANQKVNIDMRAPQYWEELRQYIDALWCACIINDKERDSMKQKLHDKIITNIKAIKKIKQIVTMEDLRRPQ